mmetsp:Transcript_7326/g.16643  ORF Transcript_7326/g.16643 Transcript_7326/m.16643 type:complete len:312 (-) Transcript_7326:1668-2603(-)
MMMGIVEWDREIFLRISSQTWKPLRPGIWTSRSTMSGYLSPRAWHASRYLRASWPPIAISRSAVCSRAPLTTSWFTSSSSTDKTRGLQSGCKGLMASLGSSCETCRLAGTSCWACLLAGTSRDPSQLTCFSCPNVPSQNRETVKVEPWLSLEWTRMVPSWSSTISEQTASPRPIPWKLFVSLVFSCSKGLKMRRCPSSEMPLPVSATSISRRCASCKYRADKVTEPLSVNLQALVIRLYMSCVNFCVSPGIKGSGWPQMPLTSRTVGLTRGLFALSTAIFVIVMTSSMMDATPTASVGRELARFSCLCFSA